MVYNLTNFTDAMDFRTQMVAMNSLTGGMLAYLILISIAIIAFIGLKKTDQDTADIIIVDMFLVGILSVLMWFIGLIDIKIITIPVVILIGAIIVKSTQ